MSYYNPTFCSENIVTFGFWHYFRFLPNFSKFEIYPDGYIRSYRKSLVRILFRISILKATKWYIEHCFFLLVLSRPWAQTTFIILLNIIWPHKKISWKRENPVSDPKVKPCGMLLVDFKRKILREWLGREKYLSFEAQNTKIFWWIRGSNNTCHCRGFQRKGWLYKKKRCYWKT